jgi:hypothetical protein
MAIIYVTNLQQPVCVKTHTISAWSSIRGTTEAKTIRWIAPVTSSPSSIGVEDQPGGITVSELTTVTAFCGVLAPDLLLVELPGGTDID